MTTVEFTLAKAGAVENDDGTFTPKGMQVMHRYARAWVDGRRDLELEREYPQLAGPFYDVRADAELASEHAIPDDADAGLEKALKQAFKPKKKPVLFVKADGE